MKVKEIKQSKIIIFLIIIALPVISRYFLANEPSISQLFSSCLFLINFSILAFFIQAKISLILFRYLFLFIVFYVLITIEITESVSFYLQGEGFNERLLFHINFDLIANAWSVYPLVTVLIIIIFFLLGLLLYQISLIQAFRTISTFWLFPLLIASLFFNSSIHNFFYFIKSVKNSQFETSNISKQKLDEYNLNAQSINQNKTKNIKETKAGKNLLFIYLESLEKIYQDENVFKGLTPNLNNFNQQGIVFDHTQQYKGTGWTIAGIVSSQCGTPLLFEYNTISSNDIMANGFLNKAICLGDGSLAKK